MPTGPKGEKRPADVIGAAVKIITKQAAANSVFVRRIEWLVESFDFIAQCVLASPGEAPWLIC